VPVAHVAALEQDRFDMLEQNAHGYAPPLPQSALAVQTHGRRNREVSTVSDRGVNGPLDFLEAACVPLDADHRSGTLDAAEAIRAAHPEVADASIYTAAVLGHDEAVRRFLAGDPRLATAKGGPRGWDALTYLCFSRYLRLDHARADAFVRAAAALLDAGAGANTGWSGDEGHWECAIYGAAGIAQHPALTRLLLERGADPNDEETPYHVPETYDLSTLRVLVESGRLTADSLATLLLRKADWHDREGVAYLLEHGADANRRTRWGRRTALHQSVLRDNHLAIVETLLAHGADPALGCDHGTAIAMAARRGRGDVLEAFARSGHPIALQGVDALLAACARGDAAAITALARDARVLDALRAQGGARLAEFAGTDNTEGVARLLELGVPVAALYEHGDPYFDIAPRATALHVAAWRACHDTVKLLIARGAPVHARDGAGRTALALAVRACVDSYWSNRRRPDSVRALLEAGASPEGVPFPCGYAEVDALLESARSR
jgi:ankyrin repeat protein